MNQSLVVCMLQSDCRLSHDFTRIGYVEMPPGMDNPGKVSSLDQFHDEKVVAVDRASIECTNDVRVIDLSDGSHFLSESAHGLLGPQLIAREDLERNVLR